MTRILIVDDEPDVLWATAKTLEGAGYEVLRAATGQECLDVMHRDRPDMVLLDVVLPDMKGTDVCALIRKDLSLHNTFIILLSGLMTSPDNQAQGLDMGADGYIARPVSAVELKARIHALDRIRLAEEELRRKNEELSKINADLSAALAEVKTLRGIIPICASCKQIKDDEGLWNQLEVYITEHTQALFSHGLCPKCMKKYEDELK